MRNDIRMNQLTHLAKMLWVRPLVTIETPKAKGADFLRAALARLEERTQLALRSSTIRVP